MTLIIIIKFILVVTSSLDDSCERVYMYLRKKKSRDEEKSLIFNFIAFDIDDV